MKFTKMHGAGNDYVYINCFTETVEDPQNLAIKVSDRHKGIGSDGLVLILPSDTCDFGMRMFNNDGSEAEMCGNASRCVGKYVYDNGLTDKTAVSLETKAGVRRLELFPLGGKIARVKVDMGEPILTAGEIPVLWDGDRLIGCEIDFPTGTYRVSCVSMGNPHAVVFTENIDGMDLEKIGPMFEMHSMFPKRVNAEFVEIISPSFVRARVWERGSGETLACGTGACAIEVAGVLNGFLERSATVSLPGGELYLEWDLGDNHVYMTGEAVTVFEGEIVL
ncbi:MAG: diaminopimelate epimerase [Dysgonamonadaceae bacterium]|jgi:diaminopimelate epimerase|nr:diaminopimelate epimerase [Dysgonamonadaceae bacterium]